MTQPPNDPASGGEPEDWPRGHPQGPGRPGPYGGRQPYGEQQPYGGQQPYGEQPYGERPYGERPYGEQPQGEQPYGQQPGYGGLPKYPGQSGYGDEPGYGAPAGHGGAGGYGDPSQALASRWARLGAAIVDIVLVGIVTSLIALPFVDWGNVFDSDTGESMYYSNAQLSSNAIGVVLAFFYYWLMHAKWGQTLGKKLLGIRVVREDNGQAITTGQAAGRSAFYSVLGGICGCIGLINVLWILWDPRKQALHCKVARTVVVKAGPNAPDPYAPR
ncbi:RDD family protein [Actinomadura sp. 6K520]|uniref:RDD family protein n=1 Tax=Actinomadura sp. 6K520 TaxID=2530364 RepID=UPI001050ECFD|nr:RDD family protein [Actinomadura sp. 6K520]TDE27350.1 RDD family protein [Actinomadura sp. 6K520]